MPHLLHCLQVLSLHSAFSIFSGFPVPLDPPLSSISHLYLYPPACLPSWTRLCILHLFSPLSPPLWNSTCVFTFFLSCHCNIGLGAAAGSLLLCLAKGHPWTSQELSVSGTSGLKLCLEHREKFLIRFSALMLPVLRVLPESVQNTPPEKQK